MSFEITKGTDEYGYIYCNYTKCHTLPSGMCIKIEFNEERTSDTYIYGISLNTMHKRKQENRTCLLSTGRDGLSGLVWAKQMVAEFEKTIREDIPNMKIIIYAAWDDNRRRDAYAYGLGKLGYRYGMLGGKKVLLKRI